MPLFVWFFNEIFFLLKKTEVFNKKHESQTFSSLWWFCLCQIILIWDARETVVRNCSRAEETETDAKCQVANELSKCTSILNSVCAIFCRRNKIGACEGDHVILHCVHCYIDGVSVAISNFKQKEMLSLRKQHASFLPYLLLRTAIVSLPPLPPKVLANHLIRLCLIHETGNEQYLPQSKMLQVFHLLESFFSSILFTLYHFQRENAFNVCQEHSN